MLNKFFEFIVSLWRAIWGGLGFISSTTTVAPSADTHHDYRCSTTTVVSDDTKDGFRNREKEKNISPRKRRILRRNGGFFGAPSGYFRSSQV